ncbi:hypothetical protein BgiMline_022559, partial [Biomphalaria glabrata]
SHRFTCMKFVRRSDNVVQVFEGPLNDLNEKNLCDESGLHLDEWPWTAQMSKEPSFCAVSGGFSYRTIKRLTNEDLCEDEWRRSTLEIECMKGDGMDFIAPANSNCNPFLKSGDWKRLSCWAGWTHGEFIFIIASDLGSEPRYCLRFPRVQTGEFSVMVYFSVICPTDPDGKPPHGIEYYELKMFRREPSQCRDEEERKCREVITSPEMCAKDTVFAPHCQETCGRCPSATISTIMGRRCWLDPQIHGEWKLHEKTRTYDVIVDREKAIFTHMGTFMCLEVESKHQRYKMVSLFDNGCSHRYTCMEFMRRNNNVLQYRTSPSDRAELKMEDLCNFRDDPIPLSDIFRSFYFKNLILAKDLWPQYCGLNSVIPFNGTVNGRPCSGNVSDWDDETCSTRGVLTLKSNTCKELILPAGFQCLAFIYDSAIPLQQILLTRSLDGRNTYNCWILTKYVSGVHWQRPLLLQMPTIQCSLIMDVQIDFKGGHSTRLYLDDAAKTKPCKPVDEYRHNSRPDSNSSNLSYYVPSKPGDEPADDTQVALHTSSTKTVLTAQPPSATVYHSTDIPYWGLEDGASDRRISDTLFAFFMCIFVPAYWLCVSQTTGVWCMRPNLDPTCHAAWKKKEWLLFFNPVFTLKPALTCQAIKLVQHIRKP